MPKRFVRQALRFLPCYQLGEYGTANIEHPTTSVESLNPM